MASDRTNINVMGDFATTAQALSLNHSTQYDTSGNIVAVYLEGEFVLVDSIAFADYVTSVIWTDDYNTALYQ